MGGEQAFLGEGRQLTQLAQFEVGFRDSCAKWRQFNQIVGSQMGRFEQVGTGLPALAAGRFNLWLGHGEEAGRAYSDEQKAWLSAIRDHLETTIDDLMNAPDFGARRPNCGRALFGAS